MVPNGAGALAESLTREARERALHASLVAFAVGAVGLWTVAVALRERNHPDLEIALGALDSAVVIALGAVGLRGRAGVFLALALLAAAGIVYGRVEGAPWQAALVNLATAVIYGRAWLGLRTVRALRMRSRRAAP